MRTALAALALLLPATPAAAAEPVPLEITVDLSTDRTAHETGEALMDALSEAGGKVIDLDLTIRPRGSDFGLTQWLSPRESRPVDCANGFGRIEDGEAFSFANPGYNHLLLRIFHAPPSVAPRVTASCTYAPSSPSQVVFTLSGRYYVSALGIPTAWDIQLRPVD